jgi:hypothetical protein
VWGVIEECRAPPSGIVIACLFCMAALSSKNVRFSLGFSQIHVWQCAGAYHILDIACNLQKQRNKIDNICTTLYSRHSPWTAALGLQNVRFSLGVSQIHGRHCIRLSLGASQMIVLSMARILSALARSTAGHRSLFRVIYVYSRSISPCRMA